MHPTHELHVHLYGALTANRLWELAKDRRVDATRIAWYKQEYLRAYGRPSRIDEFWCADEGPALLAKEYIFTEKGSFAKFQASINLPIALFPLSTFEVPLLHEAAQMHADEGLTYVEYRVFLPPYFSESDQGAYLNLLANEAKLIEQRYDHTMSVRLLLSISRDNQQANQLYSTVYKWMRANPGFAIYVTGLDFCASECGHPPKYKKALMQRILRDNIEDPSFALAVLYHVAETFEHLTPQSALRWIVDAHLMGVHRLGHATALGFDAGLLTGKSYTESEEEQNDHMAWLTVHQETLRAYGYRVGYDDGFDALQKAVRRWLSESKAIIETCPTSNLLISNLSDYQVVPATNFLSDEMLRICIGADDPGIFATTLKNEFDHCAAAGVSAARLAEVGRLQGLCTAEILSGRSALAS